MRLLSSYISYEESDLHDGQKWEKPETWKSRDLLIANHEVLPILNTLKLSIKRLLIIILTMAIFTALISYR